jgi:hypothetical protein
MVKRQFDYWSHGTGRGLWWLLVTAPLSIPSTFLIIRDAILPIRFRDVFLLQFLPSARVYWYWYVIFALIYVIVVMFFVAPAANRATLRKVKERHRKSFNQHRERTETETRRSIETAVLEVKNAQRLAKQLNPPRFEFTDASIGPCVYDDKDCLRTATTYPNVDAMFAKFHYTPQPDVPSDLFLRAHVSIGDANGKPLEKRYDGTWEEHCESESIHVATTDSVRLIIAVLPPAEHNDGDSILTWGYGHNVDGFMPYRRVWRGSEFVVWVDIVGKYEGELVYNTCFKFRLYVAGAKSTMQLTEVSNRLAAS